MDDAMKFVEEAYGQILEHTKAFKEKTKGYAKEQKITDVSLFSGCLLDLAYLEKVYNENGYLPEHPDGSGSEYGRDAMLVDLASRARMLQYGYRPYVTSLDVEAGKDLKELDGVLKMQSAVGSASKELDKSKRMPKGLDEIMDDEKETEEEYGY